MLWAIRRQLKNLLHQKEDCLCRVLVEVPIEDKVPYYVPVRLENGTLIEQEVIYEWLPVYFAKCSGLGHIPEHCTVPRTPQGVVKPNQNIEQQIKGNGQTSGNGHTKQSGQESVNMPISKVANTSNKVQIEIDKSGSVNPGQQSKQAKENALVAANEGRNMQMPTFNGKQHVDGSIVITEGTDVMQGAGGGKLLTSHD